MTEFLFSATLTSQQMSTLLVLINWFLTADRSMLEAIEESLMQSLLAGK